MSKNSKFFDFAFRQDFLFQQRNNLLPFLAELKKLEMTSAEVEKWLLNKLIYFGEREDSGVLEGIRG